MKFECFMNSRLFRLFYEILEHYWLSAAIFMSEKIIQVWEMRYHFLPL